MAHVSLNTLRTVPGSREDLERVCMWQGQQPRGLTAAACPQQWGPKQASCFALVLTEESHPTSPRRHLQRHPQLCPRFPGLVGTSWPGPHLPSSVPEAPTPAPGVGEPASPPPCPAGKILRISDTRDRVCGLPVWAAAQLDGALPPHLPWRCAIPSRRNHQPSALLSGLLLGALRHLAQS